MNRALWGVGQVLGACLTAICFFEGTVLVYFALVAATNGGDLTSAWAFALDGRSAQAQAVDPLVATSSLALANLVVALPLAKFLQWLRLSGWLPMPAASAAVVLLIVATLVPSAAFAPYVQQPWIIAAVTGILMALAAVSALPWAWIDRRLQRGKRDETWGADAATAFQ